MARHMCACPLLEPHSGELTKTSCVRRLNSTSTVLEINCNQRIRRLQMPRQETFLREAANGVEVEVLKTYDRSYAHEVFRGMSLEALEAVAAALRLEEKYEATNIPTSDAAEFTDFLWDEVCDAAIEDVRQFPTLSSFFVVVETIAGKSEQLYVSPDWPSAEVFARNRIADNA